MTTIFALLNRYRAAVAGAGLLTLSGLVAVTHAPAASKGLAADDITAEVVQQAMADAEADGWTRSNDALLIDFVEPEDGEGGSESEIAALVAELDADAGISVESAGFYSEGEHLFRLEADPDVVASVRERLEDHPLIEGVEPDLIYSLPRDAMSALEGPAPEPDKKPGRFEPNDQWFALQWHMEQIHAPEAWTQTRGEGAIVAVVDTGVAWKDAKGVRQVPDLAGTEFAGGESFVNGSLPDGLDDHAHGTHVAGTIAQTTDNKIGVTGVAFKSKIMAVKVLTGDGRGSVGSIANGIRWAADNGATVLNMSLGGPVPSRVMAKACEYAYQKGVTVVAAAGNERRSRVSYPAAYDHVVAVAATDYERKPTFYTNWGKAIDVAAPGGDTRSDKNGDGHPDGVLQNTIQIQRPMENDYLWFQGTSMASPHAAGVAALVNSAGVTNPDEVERVLEQTAVHPKNVEWDERYGAGILDANAAVKAAKGEYAPERGGLAGLLALFGLLGFGTAGVASRRGRALGVAGLFGGLALGSGAFGLQPLAYGLSGIGIGAPLLLSAAVPALIALVLLGVRPLRGLLAGLSAGYAALLLHGALVLPTLLTTLPGGPMVDRLWLLGNAVLALLLARRLSRM